MSCFEPQRDPGAPKRTEPKVPMSSVFMKVNKSLNLKFMTCLYHEEVVVGHIIEKKNVIPLDKC